jgi:hypothetical protein
MMFALAIFLFSLLVYISFLKKVTCHLTMKKESDNETVPTKPDWISLFTNKLFSQSDTF